MTHSKGYLNFCDFAKNKEFSLIGLGITNLPLVSFLYEAGASKVTVRDLKKKDDDPFVITAKNDGATVYLGEDYLKNLTEDVIVRSPVIRPDSEALKGAYQNGSLITCDTELFLRFAPCKTIGITGSDGKTTTTTLVAKILQAEGFHVILGGNIGKAMLPQLKSCDEVNSIAVLELSSFQLMNCQYSPDRCIITNLSENHLDWHRDMEEYIEAKKNIFIHQNQDGIAVFNLDNTHTSSLKTVGTTLHFSASDDQLEHGIFYRNGIIFKKERSECFPILDTKEIQIPGFHNVENYMAAIAVTSDLVSIDSILQIARTFGGVEHRIEWIRELRGVKFYNSSIDSSPTRSIACLKAFNQKIIMIAGGYDKNLDYSNLGIEICNRVKYLILCGATGEKIKNSVEKATCANKPEILCCKNFDDTAKEAMKFAREGDIVVLSPASASFDLFKNFEERGNRFKKIVLELV